ncbi:MAG: peptidase M14 [Candidatus Solibacter usitatus]|nr:peptidase M14 [Candidatus Solibacter usitatus]
MTRLLTRAALLLTRAALRVRCCALTRSLTLAALMLPLALSGAAPSPEAYFGHRMGADRTVLDWSKVTGYFQELEKGGDRVRFLEYGKSTEGRPMALAVISAPENLKRLDRYNQIQKRLADPRVTSPEEAVKLAAEGKAVVLITCSVHATEIASTHTAVEFAWKLATSKDPKIQNILNNVIVLLAPSINPDGVDIVTKWYRQTLGTPWEGTSPPELYQKYAGHDNNRDWYMFTQAENRALVSRVHNVWHPHVVYDVHQMGPTAARMFVPPWLDPVEPNIDPLIAQQCNMVGMTMAADLTAAGRKGVVVNAVYDFWTPARHYQSYHGGLRILSESASVRIASPIHVKQEQLSVNSLGYNARERSWNHLDPWPGGEWKLRDIVDDQLIAMESLCNTAALRRAEFLKGFYEINRRAAERRAPYAFILPVTQADPGAARRLLETLQFGAVEIDAAAEPFSAGAKQYPAGSFVVRMQQPWSSFAKTLLERQKYPDLRLYPGGPPKRPYDVTAHTLPLLMGVSVETVEDQFQAKLARAGDLSFPASGLGASDSDSWKRVNDAWKSGTPVWRNPQTGEFATGARRPQGFAPLKQPRVGIYKGFVPSMDEGWTRWIVEHFGWQYSSVSNAAIRAGGLNESFDVLVFADQSSAAIDRGHRQGAMPEEFTGGLGKEGAAALRQFVEAGGKLIFFNDSGEYAAEQLGVPVKNALKGVPSRDFYCPGSLLNVRLEPGSPLGLGLPQEFTIWNEQSPVWEAESGDARTVLRYAQAPVLASGWLLGEKYLADKPALVDVAVGRGRVVLFGMRPQYRAQSWLTLKLFFNALVM